MATDSKPVKGATFEVQAPLTISTAVTQGFRDALDVGDLDKLILQVQRLNTNNDASVQFQTANVLAEAAFENTGSPVTFDSATGKSVVLVDHGRYLRWKAAVTSGTASFAIVGLAR